MALEKLTKEDYSKSKKIVEQYKSQLKRELNSKQKNCKHEDFFRYEYDEDAFYNVCRNCFHEWPQNLKGYSFGGYYKLTLGRFKATEEDVENLKVYKNKLREIDKL
jgi:hypothetical protein